ncbi:18628_t:CDS:1, partial [Racocetra fulgida]
SDVLHYIGTMEITALLLVLYFKIYFIKRNNINFYFTYYKVNSVNSVNSVKTNSQQINTVAISNDS